MKTIAIYGYPGAGKTWAVEKFLMELHRLVGFGERADSLKKIGLVEYHHVGDVVIVGRYDGSKFQGTDRLSMAVAPEFTSFFPKVKNNRLLIAEGDRVNNMTFLHNGMAYGTLERIKVTSDDATLAARRKQRGHNFAPGFLKSVASKVDKHTFDKVMTSDELFEYLKTQ